jgi:aldose 1-epimerase
VRLVVHPTGAQYQIKSGDWAAVVTELGATLRSLTVGGFDVINAFAADASPSGGQGQQLVPWPNRIRDGRYEFGGKQQQLALTEPARHNASHGLARYVPWRLIEHQTDAVTHEVTIYPQPGWPGVLTTGTTYRVGSEGLTVTVEAVNRGTGPVPFGYGAHPYLTVGEALVDEVSLEIPADNYLSVDDRLLPVDLVPVNDTDFDWRAARQVGSAVLDTAFTDLSRDHDGRWQVNIRLADRCSLLWGDESMRWIQVFSGGSSRNGGIAVEPMTCGPDAFNPGPTHADLLVLEPEEAFRGRWGIGQVAVTAPSH